MPTLCLEYPNGRVHRLAVTEKMRAGQEFDLYGRRWKVVGSDPRAVRTRARRGATAPEPDLICRQTA
ncbi:MAG TPA: hypothetical protein VGC78_07775 [Gaiellaceae bacterium]